MVSGAPSYLQQLVGLLLHTTKEVPDGVGRDRLLTVDVPAPITVRTGFVTGSAYECVCVCLYIYIHIHTYIYTYICIASSVCPVAHGSRAFMLEGRVSAKVFASLGRRGPSVENKAFLGYLTSYDSAMYYCTELDATLA